MGKIDSVTCEHGHEDHNNAKNRMQAHQKQEINGLKKRILHENRFNRFEAIRHPQ